MTCNKQASTSPPRSVVASLWTVEKTLHPGPLQSPHPRPHPHRSHTLPVGAPPLQPAC
ncbi:hypothetical protein FIBSPDRAFT_855162 [Athelia psychrophila]|uniref:Uncharacterized protein n=1 Tax=Athelia psychrophila TaxID=1759441 RepID=A0A166PKW0_9AGAM|nr:hypothetical protein FIBSPDRAFT_855162 [Fibularhizoctonia sp. CBS 109695]